MILALSFSAAACSAATSFDSQKSVVVVAETDVRLIEVVVDDAGAVEVVSCLEWEEGAHAHHDGSEHFITNVKVVVGEAAALVGDNAVIGVLGGVLWYGDPEGRSYLHALEYEVHAVGILPLRSAEPA